MQTLIIREESKSKDYTKHDILYKKLLIEFFEEFVEVFFPEIHEHLDFQTVHPTSEEVHSDDPGGDSRRLDVVMETKFKGTDVAVIVHLEPQSYQQRDFNERMFLYYSLLYNRFRKPIIPIAVFSYKGKWKKTTFEMKFPFMDVVTFNYKVLHLKSKNWRDYINSNNPIAAALISEMGYKDTERVEIKKEFFRMLIRIDITESQSRLIQSFFETYLTLTEEEEEKVMDEVRKLPEADLILELPISYEEKGKEIGKEIGRKETMKQVALDMLHEGADIGFIMKVTKLSEDKIEDIKKKM